MLTFSFFGVGCSYKIMHKKLNICSCFARVEICFRNKIGVWRQSVVQLDLCWLLPCIVGVVEGNCKLKASTLFLSSSEILFVTLARDFCKYDAVRHFRKL